MGKHRDWTEIAKDYRENGLSYTQLADKYGVSVSTLKKAAARQSWRLEKRAKEKIQRIEDEIIVQENGTENGTESDGSNENGSAEPENGTEEQEAVTEDPTEMAPVVTLYPDAVYPPESNAERFQKLIDAMTDRVEDAICCVDVYNAGAIKLLTGALKDLRDLRSLNRTALDIEEQKARIEKLKSEAAIREVNQEPVVIRFVDLEGAEV